MKQLLVAVGVILGLAFLVVAFLYATKTAGELPTFLPGYAAGSVAKHMKHAIGSGVAGIACFVFAWFQSGPKTGSATPS